LDRSGDGGTVGSLVVDWQDRTVVIARYGREIVGLGSQVNEKQRSGDIERGPFGFSRSAIGSEHRARMSPDERRGHSRFPAIAASAACCSATHSQG